MLARRSRTLLALLALAACTARTPPATVDTGLAVPLTEDAQPADDLDAYVRRHDALRSPADAGWSAALERAERDGDRFTLFVLDGLDATELDAASAAHLARTRAALRARLSTDLAAEAASEAVVRLERAAWADIQCDPLEGTIVPWAQESLSAHRDDPRVRAALEAARDGYRPRTEVKTIFSSLSERVPEYARKILAGAPTEGPRTR